MNLRHGILAAAFAVLAVVAAAGWARKAPPANTKAQVTPNYYAEPSGPQTPNATVPQPASNPPSTYNTSTQPQYDSYGRPIAASPAGGAPPPPCVGTNTPEYAGGMYPGGVNAPGYTSALYEPAGPPPPYAARPYGPTYNRPVRVVRQNYVEEHRVVYRTHHRRSKKKSVAIVVGSAAAGAGIGALAGGGKGAGIGALAGGVGGFIYDRLTHNR